MDNKKKEEEFYYEKTIFNGVKDVLFQEPIIPDIKNVPGELGSFGGYTFISAPGKKNE